MDSLSSAAVQYLLGQPSVLDLLGSFPEGNPAAGQPYLFDSDLLVTLEGLSAAAIVLSSSGMMQAPPQLGSQRFERLSVEIYADPQRDAASNVLTSSAITIATVEQVFSVVHARLQRTDPDVQVWGDVVTLGCQLLAEGQCGPVQDGDLMQRKQVFYGVQLGGWTDVTP